MGGPGGALISYIGWYGCCWRRVEGLPFYFKTSREGEREKSIAMRSRRETKSERQLAKRKKKNKKKLETFLSASSLFLACSDAPPRH
jgi:hypothetical protein